MQAFETQRHNPVAECRDACSEKRRTLAYSMDLLVPGIYFWLGNFVLILGGEMPDDEPYRYPGTVHSFFGIAIVLPGYKILSTYTGSYDPR